MKTIASKGSQRRGSRARRRFRGPLWLAASLVAINLAVMSPAVLNLAGADEPGRETPARPKLARLPDHVPAPDDNPTTDAKVELGRQLFFDPRLSGDNSIRCATCHLPERSYADGLARSMGASGRPLSRNTPTVLNAGWHSSLFWDGRAGSLEEQALGPIQAADEMNQDLDELIEELAAVPEYQRQFPRVFGRSVNSQDVARALAAFQRTLVTSNSPLDRYLAGEKDALSAQARQGLELFMGSAGCIRCHHGPLLSDGKFYRLGVGRDDLGRGSVTGQLEDRYKFRTPSLRGVERTGPYMHDGSLATLYDVVQFYYRDVPSRGPAGLPLDIEPLVDQSFSDIDALVAFLKSL
ncbi:MAG: cytochrome-c peroxidase [Pirellulaceae bacterium]|nr:cytochrome-c peroxidase [Pirellulaceae bacterium]